MKMKKLLYFIPVALFLTACSPKVKPVVQETPVTLELKTFKDSANYVQGMMIYDQLASLNEDGMDMVKEEYIRLGIEEAAKGKGRISDDEDQRKILQEFQTQVQKKMQEAKEKKGKESKAAGLAYLAENKTKEGIMTTESGLQYTVLQAGTGSMPVASDKVEVHYEGRLIDGTVFDSSYQRGETTQFGLSQVIKGWTEGLQLMKEGSKYRFFIPSNLAYGPGGTRGIPPNSVLIFDVELIRIVK